MPVNVAALTGKKGLQITELFQIKTLNYVKI